MSIKITLEFDGPDRAGYMLAIYEMLKDNPTPNSNGYETVVRFLPAALFDLWGQVAALVIDENGEFQNKFLVDEDNGLWASFAEEDVEKIKEFVLREGKRWAGRTIKK